MRFVDRIRSFLMPNVLAPRLAGVEISQSAVKAIDLRESPAGLVVADHANVPLRSGSYNKGEVLNIGLLAQSLRVLREDKNFSEAHVAAPDRALTRREIDLLMQAFDDAGIKILSIEPESKALIRALLPQEDSGTRLIVDIGKTTTKLYFVESGKLARAETIPLGGHTLTLAVQKHMGVVETEAWAAKTEMDLCSEDAHNKILRAELLSALVPIRDAVKNALREWRLTEHQPVSEIIIVGGNASLRSLPDWLEGELHIPVREGDVFARLAAKEHWAPPFPKHESLAYGTVVGLALRDF